MPKVHKVKMELKNITNSIVKNKRKKKIVSNMNKTLEDKNITPFLTTKNNTYQKAVVKIQT